MSTFLLWVLTWVAAGALLLGVLRRRTLAALWREPVLKRPVLIIESDDWGAGPPQQARALEQIAVLLASHADSLGQKAVMTLGIVLSVADGARILADDLQRYYRKRLDDPDFAETLAAIKRGADKGVFALQLHGEEHYWSPALLAAARADPQLASWFRNPAPETEALPAGLQSRWIDAARLPSKPLPPDDLRAAALAEVASFETVFGYRPSVAVPPTFIWNHAVETAWAQAGIRYVVTPGRRYEARDARGEPIAAGPAIRNGQRSAAGLCCLVRDDYFEPAMRGHRAERALAALARKTAAGRPTLLETHRANFLDASAEASLRELDRLLAMATQRFPQLLFLSTEALATRLRENDPQLVERRLPRRLYVWVLRLLHPSRR